jgi:hypothetical protein
MSKDTMKSTADTLAFASAVEPARMLRLAERASDQPAGDRAEFEDRTTIERARLLEAAITDFDVRSRIMNFS